MIAKRHSIKRLHGKLIAYPGRFLKRFAWKELLIEKTQVLKAEQTNTSLLYGNKLFFKLFRRLDEGINPDLEIGRFLTEKASFPHVSPFAGAIEYRRPGSEPIVVGMLQSFIPHHGDAWTYTLDSVERYFERVLSKKTEIQQIPKTPSSLLEIDFQDIPLLLHELIGGDYLEMAALLGKRTAELHISLSSDKEDPSFAAEPFSVLYQRSMYQSMQSLTKRVFELLRKNVKTLPDNIQEDAHKVLGFEKEIMDRFKTLFKRRYQQ